MVELVDSLDSGSSVHCGRAGSSPASPTKKKRHPMDVSFSYAKMVIFLAKKQIICYIVKKTLTKSSADDLFRVSLEIERR